MILIFTFHKKILHNMTLHALYDPYDIVYLYECMCLYVCKEH